MHINCDVGEGVNNEALLMPYINACNIACGGHAGDVRTMHKVVKLAKLQYVEIGAHPSYPDRENFGRRSIKIDDIILITSIRSQIEALKSVLKNYDAKLHHIKAHGALYNDIAKDVEKAKLFLKAIEKYKHETVIYVPYQSEIEQEALRQNFTIIYEAFADRNYTDNLILVSRENKHAVLTKIEEIIEHVSSMKNEQKVKTISGKKLPIKATTFCVHSDTKNAVEIVANLYNHFRY